MKFKIGDVVKIKEDLNCDNSYKEPIIDRMENYKGKLCRINRVFGNGKYGLDIDDIPWIWSDDTFDLVKSREFTKSDLKDGDLITYRNGDKAIKIKGKLRDLVGKTDGLLYISDITEELKYYIGSTNEQLDIIKVERPVKYEIVYERTEEEEKEILNKVEKNYLTRVIKPFRDTIKYIVKIDNGKSEEYESLEIDFKDNDDYMSFPNFKKGTMYKGMKLNKKYTLEELRL